jgi:hypothetical protein
MSESNGESKQTTEKLRKEALNSYEGESTECTAALD